MDKGNNDLEDKLDRLEKELGRFSTEKRISHYMPEIISCIRFIKKNNDLQKEEIEELNNKLSELNKKFSELDTKSLETTLEEAYKVLDKAKGKVISHWFSNYLKSDEGNKLVDNVIQEHKDPIKSMIIESIRKDKGFLASVAKNVRFYVTTRVGIAALVSLVVLGVGGWYGTHWILTRTEVGKMVGYQNKTDRLESEIYAPKKNAKGKITGYESRIDKVEEKQKELEKRLDTGASRKEMEEFKKNSDEQDKAKFEAYDKQITDIRSSLDSSSKNYNDLKLNYDELKKSDENNLKRIDDLQKNNENLEKKMIDSEKNHEKWYKKVIPLKSVK